MATKELTWPEAIQRVLAEAGGPLHYSEITDRIIARGLRKSLGATPSATVNAQISANIKKRGVESLYRRTGKGTFALASQAPSAPAAESVRKVEPVQEEAAGEGQYDVVTSFGMFWRRDLVEWKTRPKLPGMMQIGATPVNFEEQLGIYLLYDGREVIYVGRFTDRPLGKRLYEHTMDRFSARWDRFSWFGLRPVSEDGSLGDMPASYDATRLLPALEAILIEALEPRQNRKRGDDLAAVEFIQQEDPEIKKRRAKATVEDLLGRM